MSELDTRYGNESLLAVPENPRIVVIGGGGGTAAIYPEIARRTENATAVLGIFDSGGSTGEISKQMGVPAVGDIRNVMMAASQNPAVRELRRHRFNKGESFRGHSVGNFVVAACVQEYGLQEGVRQAGLFLQVPGTVLPVALESAELQLEDGPGRVIKGEHFIDTYRTTHPQPRVSLAPQVPINPDVKDAIDQADLVLIPGGSIYTSLLAALSVNGVAKALKETCAPKVLLSNLATEEHQTDGWHVADYVEALNRHDIHPDVVLFNTAMPTQEMLENYAEAGERPVDNRPEGFSRIPLVRAIGAELLAHECISPNPNDPIKRGLMRHDASAVSDQLWQIMAEAPAAVA